MRQYVGGDPHHMRQRFPRVVLRDEVTFGGFLDGYEGGDGCRITRWPHEGADSWPRGTFQAEERPVELDESAWVEVRSVTLRAPSAKPSTLYDFGLTPHPDFLVNGHLVRTPWET